MKDCTELYFPKMFSLGSTIKECLRLIAARVCCAKIFCSPFKNKPQKKKELRFTSLIQDRVLSENSVYHIILRSFDNTQCYIQYVPI